MARPQDGGLKAAGPLSVMISPFGSWRMPPSGRLKEAQLRALLTASAVDVGSAAESLKSCRGSMLDRSLVAAKPLGMRFGNPSASWLSMPQSP